MVNAVTIGINQSEQTFAIRMEASHEQTSCEWTSTLIPQGWGLDRSALLYYQGLHCICFVTEGWFTPSLKTDAQQSESWLWISITLIPSPRPYPIIEGFQAWGKLTLEVSLTRPSILFPTDRRTWLHQSPSWQTPPKKTYDQRTPRCFDYLIYSDFPLHRWPHPC